MIKNNSRADDLEADISQFIYLFLSKISLQFPRNTTRGGRANRDRYIKQDHTEFIVTGLRINPGCTVHTTRHVIPKLRPSVYFFPYCLNCLDLVIVKPQVKDTRHCLAGFFFFFTANICIPHLAGWGMLLWDREGWKILKLFFLITRILDSRLILSLFFHLGNTCSLSTSLLAALPFCVISLSLSLPSLFYFADTSRKWLRSRPIRRSECNSFFFLNRWLVCYGSLRGSGSGMWIHLWNWVFTANIYLFTCSFSRFTSWRRCCQNSLCSKQPVRGHLCQSLRH